MILRMGDPGYERRTRMFVRGASAIVVISIILIALVSA